MNELALNKFDDINDPKLRAYNRYVFFHNLFVDLGYNAAREYAEMFEEFEKQQMLLVGMAIKKFGLKETQAMLTKDMVFEDAAA